MTVVVTRELVLRVEGAMIAERRAFALGSARERPDGAVLALESGTAVYTGPGLFSNRVFGVGLGGPALDEDLARFEDFYRDRGRRTELEVASLAEPDSLGRLAERGYRTVRFRNVYAKLAPIESSAGDSIEASTVEASAVQASPVEASAVEVTAVDATSATEWSEVLVDVFAGSDRGRRQAVGHWNRGLLDTDGVHAFVAKLDGSTVGSASVYLADGCAVLGGAATMVSRRRRGVQTALIAARLDLARRASCDLAVVTADPGSSSARNAERAGFTLVCTHAVLADGGKARIG